MVNADPTVVPLKASIDFEVLRFIAYLHGVRRLATISLITFCVPYAPT
jgi:hypothetical protein